MNLIAHILVLSIAAYLFQIICILNRKFNNTMLYLCIAAIHLLVWTFCNLMILLSSTPDACQVWYKAGSLGQCYFSAFLSQFMIRFSGKHNFIKKWWAKILFYIPPAILLCAFLFDKVIIDNFIVISAGNIKKTIILNVWMVYYIIMHITYLSTGILYLVKWRLKLKYPSEKKKGRKIVTVHLFSFIVCLSVGIISIMIKSATLFMLVPALAAFGFINMWYSFNYEWVELTPSLAIEYIFNNMADSVILVDSELKILTVNPEMRRLIKYTEEELIGKDISFIFEKNPYFDIKEHLSSLRDNKISNIEAKLINKVQAPIPITFSASEYRDEDNVLVGIVIICHDISHQERIQSSLKHLARHDHLTNLPNRLLFNDRLEQSLALAKRYSYMVGVMFMDIDGFKEVNDDYGHDAGDNLLIDISERLKTVIRKTDTLARLGGDEFIMIINNLKSYSQINGIAEKVLSVFSEKFSIGINRVSVSASLGISVYPLDGDTTEELLKNADTAMYHAKALGKNNFQIYSHELSRKTTEKFIFENKLRNAIEKNEFILHYQPIVDIITGNLVGIEALVRWQDSQTGLILPHKFITAAEETGLIVQIGEYVIRTACNQLSKWIRMGMKRIPISVNLSNRQFQHKNLIEMVTGIVEESGLDSGLLQFEITENTAMRDPAHTLYVLRELKNMGITFIIDDFGIGLSSLNYLRSFPIDGIKIDRSFIQNVITSKKDATTTTAIMAMANTMNLRVIAEGVETEDQLKFLTDIKWEHNEKTISLAAQGYYFCKPLAEKELTEKYLKLRQNYNNSAKPVNSNISIKLIEQGNGI